MASAKKQPLTLSLSRKGERELAATSHRGGRVILASLSPLAGEGQGEGSLRGAINRIRYRTRAPRFLRQTRLPPPDPREGRLRRIKALARKETLQTLRDPSSLIVAVVLPMILLFLYGYGVSFDVTTVRIGLVIEDPTPWTDDFAPIAFQHALLRCARQPQPPGFPRRSDGRTPRRHRDRLRRFLAAAWPRRHRARADHHRRHRPEHGEPRHGLCPGRVAVLAQLSGC